jgi:16S rRNA (uracil1498-N3)-methyltransferase
LLASLREDAVSLKEVLGGLPEDLEGVDLLVGPEGDFSVAESESVEAAGFQLVSFGPLILRAETAVMYGLSALGYELR